jgi:hypothetical protein
MSDDAQGVEIVIEAPAMTDQALIQRSLAGMSEGRMADVVNQRKGLGKIFIQAKRSGSGAGDLRDFNRVSEPAAEMIGGAAGKHLRLPCEPAERTSLHDAFAIALEGRARTPRRRGVDAGDKKIIRLSGDRTSMEIDCHSQIQV